MRNTLTAALGFSILFAAACSGSSTGGTTTTTGGTGIATTTTSGTSTATTSGASSTTSAGTTDATTSAGSSSSGSTGGVTATTGGETTAGSTGGATTGASTATTGSGTATTGGTTGTCVSPVQGGNEFNDCSTLGTNGSCVCPLVCTSDANTNSGQACELPCSTTADCTNPGTICINSFCRIDSCDPNYPVSDGGSLNGPCDSIGIADGTCLDNPNSNGNSKPAQFCVRGGSATTNCVYAQLSSTPETSCPLGDICTAQSLLYGQDNGIAVPYLSNAYSVPPGNYTGICVPLCDWTGTVDAGCSPGLTCIESPISEFSNGSSGYCSTQGGNGCATASSGTEFGYCDQANNNFDCACPQSCVSDTFYSSNVCESPCVVDGDCPGAGDMCIAGQCQNHLCGNAIIPDSGTAGPVYFAPCTVDAGNDGTCVPSTSSIGTTADQNFFGVCYLGGTATTTCDPTISRDIATLCPTSQFCFGGTCEALCDPTAAASTCPTGVACYEFNANPSAGICFQACLPTGTACLNNGDCCSYGCGSGFVCN